MSNCFEAIVIGASSGGLEAFYKIFSKFHEDFSIPIFLVQHIKEGSDNYYVQHINRASSLDVLEAVDKIKINRGKAYVAPPGYHLLVEDKTSLSLSADPRVNFSRPSIDVLFDSAAHVYKDKVIGVLLTGANSDGALGIKKIHDLGGYTIVQNPETALSSEMPRSALAITKVDEVLELDQIASRLNQLDGGNNVK